MTRAPPAALRLIAAAPLSKTPKPPFGIASWSPAAPGTAYVFGGDPRDLASVDILVPRIPSAREVPSGTVVVLFGTCARGFSWWGRFVAKGNARVGRAARCGALLVRGYVDISAAIDSSTGEDLVWGWSP